MDPALNVTQFPSEEFSKPIWEEKSATEELLEMLKNHKISVGSDDDSTQKIQAGQA